MNGHLRYCEVNSKILLRAIDPEFFLRFLPRDDDGWVDLVLSYVLLRGAEIDDVLFCRLIDKLYPSDISLTIHHIDKVVKLFNRCPKVEELPTEVQKHVIESIIDVCLNKDQEYPLGERVTFICKGLQMAEMISNVDKETLSHFHASLGQFFARNPKVLQDLKDAEVELLHEFLPTNVFLKLFATLQKQCKAREGEAAKLKEQKSQQADVYKKELGRFDDARSVND